MKEKQANNLKMNRLNRMSVVYNGKPYKKRDEFQQSVLMHHHNFLDIATTRPLDTTRVIVDRQAKRAILLPENTPLSLKSTGKVRKISANMIGKDEYEVAVSEGNKKATNTKANIEEITKQYFQSSLRGAMHDKILGQIPRNNNNKFNF